MPAPFFSGYNQESDDSYENKRRSEKDQSEFKTERRKRIGIGIRLGNDLFKGFRNIFPLINAS